MTRSHSRDAAIGVALATVVLMLGAVLVTSPAEAHTAYVFHPYRWQATETQLLGVTISKHQVRHYTAGGGWNSTRRNDVDASDNQWSGVPTDHYFSYFFGGQNNDLVAYPCDSSNQPASTGINRNGHWWITIDGPDDTPTNTLARAKRCVTSTNQIINFQMWYDSEYWHFGSGSPSSAEYDFRSTVTHELGHGTGFSHFLQGDSLAHCHSTPDSHTNTMCEGSAQKGQTYRRTIGGHDTHTMQEAYT